MSEPDSKRRKVRKGTHSCWECRRRKIRCQFASHSDRVCIGCRGRDTACISQEYVDEQLPPQPDRRLAQRLGRLEELMERLVDRIAPERLEGVEFGASSPSAGGPDDTTADVLASAVGENASVVALLTAGCDPLQQQDQMQQQSQQQQQQYHQHKHQQPPPPGISLPTPESEASSSGTGAPRVALGAGSSAALPAAGSKYERVCRTLHGLFPSSHDINVMTSASTGAVFVLRLLYSDKEYEDGRCETPADLALIPPVTSHPAVLAKRLLQLSICLQQLPPSFDERQLWLRKSVADTAVDYASAVANLVTANDDLVGSLEGLECLVLQSFFQTNAGHLRKAWLTVRRAASLAQLMGVDRRAGRPVRSFDPRADPAKRPAPSRLWYKIIFIDRYLSLMLGLPTGTPDDSALDAAGADPDETPLEAMERRLTTASGRIIERNRARASEAYGITQAIDWELEMAAKMTPDGWWQAPQLDPYGTPAQIMTQMRHMMLQIHHYTLLIFLHLPYMMCGNAPTVATGGAGVTPAGAGAGAAGAIAGGGGGATVSSSSAAGPAASQTTAAMIGGMGDARYEYSRTTCLRASREVLERFNVFRAVNRTAYSCRHVDYSSLVAAMTLVLGYVCRPSAALSAEDRRQKDLDRTIVKEVVATMENVSVANHDKLCRESADIIKHLLPIIEYESCARRAEGTLQLNVPYLGKINIHPPAAAGDSSSSSSSSAAAAAKSKTNVPVLSASASASARSTGGSSSLLSSPAVPTPATPVPPLELEAPLDVTHFPLADGDYDFGGGEGFDWLAFPDLTAEAGDWAFQGVDTMYWSSLTGGFN